MNSFDTFGIFGPEFTAVRQMTLERHADRWSGSSFERQAHEAWTQSGFIFDTFLSLQHHFGACSLATLVKFWPCLATSFSPELQDGKQLASQTDRLVLSANLSEQMALVQHEADVAQRRINLNAVCYGPWTEQQLERVCKHHPRLFELGCGSGYLLSVLRDRGIDARGAEPDGYSLCGDLPNGGHYEGPISRLFDWSGELRGDGFLLSGSTELLPDFSNYTLLISWPEPGGAWVAEGIRRYREAGGERLLFKLGGFVGRFSPPLGHPYSPPANPGLNIMETWEEIAKWWGPCEGSMKWIPELRENNLWEFRVRKQPRYLPWEDAPPPPPKRSAKDRAVERRKKKKTNRRGKKK